MTLRRGRSMRWLALALLIATGLSHATPSVVDDAGATISLPSAARRIVSLAPHATELLFAAGAGDLVVGVSSGSDFPEQAQRIASIGGSTQVDLDRIVSLQPDLVVAWKSGNPARQIARLRALGIAVFESEPRSFDGIATTIEKLATLAGTTAHGQQSAQTFRQQHLQLQHRYAGRAPVVVFYQIWAQPLMTLNATHLVSQALTLCGAQNAFGSLPQLAPTIGTEAVVSANPEAIFISDQPAQAMAKWRRFPRMAAVERSNLFVVNGTLLNRAGPRMLDGVGQLCEQVEQVRLRRPH